MSTKTETLNAIPSRPEDGRWRRFVNIYRSIRVPWVLLFATLGLGILGAQVVLWIAPLTARIGRGDFTTGGLVPAFIGLTVAGICITLARALTDLYAQTIVTRRVQEVVWAKLLRAPMAVIDREKGSELVSRVTNDPLKANDTLYALFAVWTSLFGFGGALLAMAQANATLSLLFLVIVPIAVLTFWVVGVTEFIAQRKIMRAWGTMTGFFAERLGMFTAIKALGADDAEITAGDKAIDKMFHAGIVQALLMAVQTLMGSVVTKAATLIVFVGGAAFVRSGELTQEDLTLYWALVGAALPFLFEILTHYQMVKGAQGFTEKIGRVLELPQEDTRTGLDMPLEGGDLRLDGVTFGYGGRPVLTDVSVTIPHGKTTAIVGTNGSGKSTMLKLLQRVYEPDAGVIRYGETPIRDIALDTWRRSIGTVAQSTALLSGSVRENIAFGDLTAPQERVEWAAGIADAREFIDADPRGYDMPVGEGGDKLSGGQRQRIAIARALVPDPTVLILDEAGSALDRRTNARVDAALRAETTERTVVLVTHRPSSLADADQIIVLNKGRVEAVGRHDDLVRDSRTYRRLVQADSPAMP